MFIYSVWLIWMLVCGVRGFLSRPSVHSLRVTGLRSTEEEAIEALERLWSLDSKFGEGCGAAKERAKLQQIVKAWEVSQEEEFDEEECKDEEICAENVQGGAYIDRHGQHERVALFGGDPARRKQSVEKRLHPYGCLEQFGTPRDVGDGDRQRLVQKIRKGAFDVVYIWTRFGNHSATKSIRSACQTSDTRFVEIESLSRIAPP